MDAQPNPIRLEDLLVHAAWVNTLARRLVADPQAAEDLVQDTWLAAMRRPPSSAGNLRGWLARVVRNVAHQRRRAGARRVAREEFVGADREPVASPEELVERVETQRRVAALVLELEEPLRRTLLLHFYDGLSSAEIARRLELAESTVRSRLGRGLEVLRGKLDERLGGRETWSLLLAPLARRPATAEATVAAGSTSLLQGLFAMNLGWKLGAAVACLALLATLTPLGGIALELVRGPDLIDMQPLATSFRPLVHESAGLESGAQEERATRSTSAREAAASPQPPRTAISLRVLDPTGRPLAGARVWLRLERASLVRTDADGLCRLEIGEQRDLGWSHEVVVDDPRYLRAAVDVRLREDETVELGDVRLRPCGALEGQVLDAAGQPVAGAVVSCEDLERDRDYLERERVRRTARRRDGVCSDAEGRFFLPRASVGLHSLWAAAPGHLASYRAPVEVRADAVTEGVVIRLGIYDPADFIAGVVLDPAGRPVPYARLEVEYHSWARSGSGSLNADGEGRFRLPYAHRVPRTLRARDREGRWRSALREGVEGGEQQLVLQLGEPTWIEVAVTGPAGPVDAPRVAAYDADHRRVLVSWRDVELHGSVARFIVPDEPFLVEVDCEGFELELTGPYAGTSAPERIEARLQALPGVRGRVLAGGEPLAGARLELRERARQHTERNGFVVRVSESAAARAESGDEGRFALTLRRAGSFYLRAEAEGFAPLELGPLELDPERGLGGLELELSEGGVLEGRLLTARGESSAGMIVGLSRGDGHAVTRRVGADGAYRFEHLMPGAWNLVRRDAELGGHSFESFSDLRGFDESQIATNCTLREGETTTFDLDLAGGAAEVVLLGLLELDGAAARGWEARLTKPGRAISSADLQLTTQVGADGSFRLVAPRAGRYRLVLSPPDESGRQLSQVLELSAGVSSWGRSLETGSLLVPNPGPPSALGPPLEFYLASLGELNVLAPLVAGPEGPALIRGLPVGEGRIVRFGLEELSLLAEFPTRKPGIVRVDLRAGETIEVRLP